MIYDKNADNTPREILRNYLKIHGLRKTPERFFILEEICKTEGHFDIEQLLKKLKKNKRYCVSRATVYNTMEILTACRLVVRHDFDTARSSYERNYNNNHEHLICDICGKISEVENEKMAIVEKEMSEKTGFDILSHRFYFYGICPNCLAKMDMQNGEDQEVSETEE